MSGRTVRPMQVQDREDKSESQEPSSLGKRLNDLKVCHRNLVLEEGGQGVLIHRKDQGLCANRAHRPVVRTSVIVNKTARPTS